MSRPAQEGSDEVEGSDEFDEFDEFDDFDAEADRRRRRGGRSASPDAWGIVPAYEDAFGTWTEVDPAVIATLRTAMGGDTALKPDGDGGERDAAEGQPRRAHLPDNLRIWGWAVQVYALHSVGSWGIGDFADLRELGRWSAAQGAGVLLINPVDAVGPLTPRETSPYFPTSRRFLDPLYLRIDEVPGAAAVADDLAPLATAARDSASEGGIDRDAVSAAKMTALELIWDRSGRASSDDRLAVYRRERADELESFATFLALAEEQGTGWRDWPGELGHPDAAGVSAFAIEHHDRIDFHGWVQWLCDQQLASAGAEIGLLRDLPIGFDPDGADAWVWQDLLADGVTIGAPPDELGPQGQNWALPAFVPWKLRAADYRPVTQTLRASLRHAGALRIDHVLGLFRLFWIPPDGSAADGTYVRQDTAALLDIVARESRAAGAFVVGEDLGTVEEGVRDELDARDILRYQVLWFDDDPLETWATKALASVTTHDLPTVAGVWDGEDARMQAALGLEPDDDWHGELRTRMAAMTGLPPSASAGEVTVALHARLAAAPNAVVLVQLEDALAVTERPNVPGTTRDQRANWSLPLPVAVEDLPTHPTLTTLAAAMAAARPLHPDA